MSFIGTFQIIQDNPYYILREGKITNLIWENKPSNLPNFPDIIFFKKENGKFGFFDENNNLLIHLTSIVFDYFDKNPKIFFFI